MTLPPGHTSRWSNRQAINRPVKKQPCHISPNHKQHPTVPCAKNSGQGMLSLAGQRQQPEGCTLLCNTSKHSPADRAAENPKAALAVPVAEPAPQAVQQQVPIRQGRGSTMKDMPHCIPAHTALQPCSNTALRLPLLPLAVLVAESAPQAGQHQEGLVSIQANTALKTGQQQSPGKSLVGSKHVILCQPLLDVELSVGLLVILGHRLHARSWALPVWPLVHC